VTHHHDIMQGGVIAMLASAGSGFAAWFFGQEATPAVITSVTMGLLIGLIKLWDAWRRARFVKRERESQRAEFDSRPHHHSGGM